MNDDNITKTRFCIGHEIHQSHSSHSRIGKQRQTHECFQLKFTLEQDTNIIVNKMI